MEFKALYSLQQSALIVRRFNARICECQLFYVQIRNTAAQHPSVQALVQAHLAGT